MLTSNRKPAWTGTNYSQEAVNIDDSQLRDKLMKLILSDPTFETVRLAEGFMIECLEKAIQNPTDKIILPFLEKFLKNSLDDFRKEIYEELDRIRNKLDSFILNNNNSDIDYALRDLESRIRYVEAKCFGYWKT